MNDSKIKDLEDYIFKSIIEQYNALIRKDYKNSHTDDVLGHIENFIEPELKSQMKSSIRQQKEKLTNDELILIDEQIKTETEGLGKRVVKALIANGRLEKL